MTTRSKYSGSGWATTMAMYLVGGGCSAEVNPEQHSVAQSAALYCDAEVPPACPDAGAPVLVDQPIVLWPPNHKFHTITASDCVGETDACGGVVEAHFTQISSDEPADARGDGHHAPDMIVDSCRSVQLRAERQGPGDGRVYTLEVVATTQDGASTHGTCTVIVPHDMAHLDAGDNGPAVTMDACPGE